MSGETKLETLLQSMEPILYESEFCFLTFPNSSDPRISSLQPFAKIEEEEGTTLIVKSDAANSQGITELNAFKRISLTVHSSLNAVGLTAAIASKLAEKGISANVVAGYFHDHIFVPSESAQSAMESLAELSRS